MAWKNIKQRSLGDALIVEHKALTELDDVHALINWLPLEAQLNGIHSKARGEKAWPPLMMFKALLLQSWYTLSDPQLGRVDIYLSQSTEAASATNDAKREASLS